MVQLALPLLREQVVLLHALLSKHVVHLYGYPEGSAKIRRALLAGGGVHGPRERERQGTRVRDACFLGWPVVVGWPEERLAAMPARTLHYKTPEAGPDPDPRLVTEWDRSGPRSAPGCSRPTWTPDRRHSGVEGFRSHLRRASGGPDR